MELLFVVALLSGGLVMLYRSFLTSLTVLEEVEMRRAAVRFIGDRLWEAEDLATRTSERPRAVLDEPASLPGGRQARYQLKITPLTPDNLLLEMNYIFSWSSGRRQARLTRTAYLRLRYPEEAGVRS